MALFCFVLYDVGCIGFGVWRGLITKLVNVLLENYLATTIFSFLICHLRIITTLTIQYLCEDKIIQGLTLTHFSLTHSKCSILTAIVAAATIILSYPRGDT